MSLARSLYPLSSGSPFPTYPPFNLTIQTRQGPGRMKKSLAKIEEGFGGGGGVGRNPT